jgi:hypothetical protein
MHNENIIYTHKHIYLHTHNGTLFSLLKRKLPFVRWMKLEDIKLNDMIQEQKGKYCMISLIYGIYKSQTQRNRVECLSPVVGMKKM